MDGSLKRVFGIAALGVVLAGSCARSTAPGVPIAAPTRSRAAPTSRSEVWQILPDLVESASLVVIATPNGRVGEEPPVENGPDRTRPIFEMRLQGVLKGDVDLSTPIGVIDGVAVDPAEDYPSGQLLSAKSSFLLFLRRFEYEPGVETDNWVLLGPEGARVRLDGVLDDADIGDATFAAIPIEPGTADEQTAELTVEEVCSAIKSSGESPGNLCK